MKQVVPYLRHILDAISAVEEYTALGRDAFLGDRRTRDAVIRNLEIIGEASRHIPSAFRCAHQGVPWEQVAALRNVLIHEYFGVDIYAVWAVVEKELPVLKALILEALQDAQTAPQAERKR